MYILYSKTFPWDPAVYFFKVSRILQFRQTVGPVKCSHIYSPCDSELSALTVIKYNLAYIFTAGTDCQANEKLPRQSRLTSSRVLWKSSPQLLFCRWHSISLFLLLSISSSLLSPDFTCRVAAAVSKGEEKSLLSQLKQVGN